MTVGARKIVLPGGTGFLGKPLADWFADRGWEVVVLSRRPAATTTGARHVVWDGATLGPWRTELVGAAAVVNLAGRSVNCRYHARNRKQMMRSRVDSTRILGEAIAACSEPPPVWINSSTATIYKHTFGPPWDENGQIGAAPEAKDAFSIDVATAWETAFEEAVAPSRKITIRTAMVFGDGAGGVYQVMRRLARFRLGGAMAGGRQFVSWIHENDFCRAVEWLINHDNMDGIVNLAAPTPVTNAEMMQIVRDALGVRVGLPTAGWMLEVGAVFIRTETELIIKSRRVIPGRLLAEGFDFEFPDIASAVRELERRITAAGGQRGALAANH